MAANIRIMRWTGTTGTPVKTDITGVLTRANAYDGDAGPTTPDTANPVQIPTGANNYSYWVSTRLSATTSPQTQISALRWFADGANNYNGPANAITTMGMEANTTYVQATGSAGTGNQLTTVTNTSLLGAPLDVFINYTVAAPRALTGSATNATTGDFGNFFVYQMVVASNALPGTSGTETFTWKYDES